MALETAELNRYVDRVREIPRLSREEEHALALRAQAGEQRAVDRLVEANLRYVVAIALSYRRYGVRIGDLIAEGNLGLMIAVRKFDPQRGTRFVTYAGYWIRAYVLDCVVRSTTMVGAGSGPLRSKLFFRLRRERARVGAMVADEAERLHAMAARFDVSTDKMREMLRRLDARDVSLDAPLFDDSGTTLLDTLVATGAAQDERVARARQQHALGQRLRIALRVLDGRERFIVEQRLLTDDEMSLAAIGRSLGVSRERARQLEARAKRKLRDQLRDFAPAA